MSIQMWLEPLTECVRMYMCGKVVQITCTAQISGLVKVEDWGKIKCVSLHDVSLIRLLDYKT